MDRHQEKTLDRAALTRRNGRYQVTRALAIRTPLKKRRKAPDDLRLFSCELRGPYATPPSPREGCTPKGRTSHSA